MAKFCVLLLAFFACNFTSILAQEDKGKFERREIEFLQRIIVDSGGLQRPENRAYIYAKVGHILWQTDEKTARKLFQDSINEIITAQNELQDKQDTQGAFQGLIFGQSPRWEILFLIANHDAEFALDAMNKSRPAKISQLIAENSRNKQSRLRHFAATEMQNEQRLIGIEADQNPEGAVKLLRENMKKNVSYETLNLLRKIFQTDAALANSLAEEIGGQFLKTDLVENSDKMGTLSYFLSVFLVQQQKPDGKDLKIPDNLIRDLESRLLDAMLDPKLDYYQNHENNLEYFQKNFPDRYAKLKQRLEERSNTNQTPQQKEYYKLLQSDSSPAELLNQAENFPQNMRREIYRQAASKLAESGNFDRAREVFEENFSEEEADNYISNYAFSRASKAVSQEKFDEVFSLIDQIKYKNQKISLLISMASVIFEKNREENKNRAISILEHARSLLPQTPESESDLNSLSMLAGQFAVIEPEKAFSIIEQLVGPLEELSQASAVIAKYRGYGNYRLGEFQISGGNSSVGVSGFENVLKSLKQKDFDRALRITNNFSRPEIRLSLKVSLIDDSSFINLPINNRVIFRSF